MPLEPCSFCATKPTPGCWACGGSGKIEAVDPREIAPALIAATTPSRAGASNPAVTDGGRPHSAATAMPPICAMAAPPAQQKRSRTRIGGPGKMENEMENALCRVG